MRNSPFFVFRYLGFRPQLRAFGFGVSGANLRLYASGVLGFRFCVRVCVGFRAFGFRPQGQLETFFVATPRLLGP